MERVLYVYRSTYRGIYNDRSFRRLLYVYEKIDIPVEYVIVFLMFALSLILDGIRGELRKLIRGSNQ
jgi:hypothetical protein